MSEKVEQINPFVGDKRAKHEQVRGMFNDIAPRYDVMNRLMSLGMDRSWRRATVEMAAAERPKAILDIATGTGDLAIQLARGIEGARVTGVDLSEGMIEAGRRKVAEAGLQDRVDLRNADALALPFADNSFDVITVAFGVRNFEHLDAGYAEMHRVLRPGGLLLVLELTPPASAVVRPFYRLYTRGVIPAVGRMVSGSSRAYAYLPESIEALMDAAGFAATAYRCFTMGVCTLYHGRKG